MAGPVEITAQELRRLPAGGAPPVVNESNLHRQILYRTAGGGRPRAEVAPSVLQELNPHFRTIPIQDRLTSANAPHVVQESDLVTGGRRHCAWAALDL